MAVTTNRPILRNSWSRPATALAAVLEAAVILALAQREGLWPLAVLAVLFLVWWRGQSADGAVQKRSGFVINRVPHLLMALSAVLVIATTPRLATQVAVAILYIIWRVWWHGRREGAAPEFVNLLLVQAACFEAIFMMAAIWRTPSWLILILVWAVGYVSVFAALSRRGERAAGVMAATWGLVAAEISWVLLLWLFTYTTTGGYVLVPQPALILTALGYCFGSIYISQREGNLSRTRLAEYLLIGLSLIAIVIIGTSWRGTL